MLSPPLSTTPRTAPRNNEHNLDLELTALKLPPQLRTRADNVGVVSGGKDAEYPLAPGVLKSESAPVDPPRGKEAGRGFVHAEGGGVAVGSASCGSGGRGWHTVRGNVV